MRCCVVCKVFNIIIGESDLFRVKVNSKIVIKNKQRVKTDK